ncbi:hypothetical protein [Chromobacterium paludis]|nr:hypothetical protein [Chromobacterium paludis]
MEYPEFGTAPIKCGRSKCKWRGYETQMARMPDERSGLAITRGVCPVCGCSSYSFMTEREIKAWERKKEAAHANP